MPLFAVPIDSCVVIESPGFDPGRSKDLCSQEASLIHRLEDGESLYS